jgi:serine protease inhibitor
MNILEKLFDSSVADIDVTKNIVELKQIQYKNAVMELTKELHVLLSIPQLKSDLRTKVERALESMGSAEVKLKAVVPKE